MTLDLLLVALKESIPLVIEGWIRVLCKVYQGALSLVLRAVQRALHPVFHDGIVDERIEELGASCSCAILIASDRGPLSLGGGRAQWHAAPLATYNGTMMAHWRALYAITCRGHHPAPIALTAARRAFVMVLARRGLAPLLAEDGIGRQCCGLLALLAALPQVWQSIKGKRGSSGAPDGTAVHWRRLADGGIAARLVAL